MPSHVHTEGTNVISGNKSIYPAALCNYGYIVPGIKDLYFSEVRVEQTDTTVWRPNTASSGSTSAHTHTVSETTHTHTISSAEGSNLPPWYSLVYCVKLVS